MGKDRARPDGFLLRPFMVRVAGFGEYFYPARSRMKALADAWRAYVSAYNEVSFGDFLRIGHAYRTEPPARFGEPVLICGKPAFVVGESGQYVRFVRPGETETFLSHPADVQGNADAPKAPHHPPVRLDRNEGEL